MASRKITLSEAVDFCTRSSDEEDIADDDRIFAENNEDAVVDSTMFGNSDVGNFILENKHECFVVSILLLMKTITNLLTCLKLRKKR